MSGPGGIGGLGQPSADMTIQTMETKGAQAAAVQQAVQVEAELGDDLLQEETTSVSGQVKLSGKVAGEKEDQVTKKRTDLNKSLSAFVRKEEANEEFNNFKNRDDNRFIKLPQEKFVDILQKLDKIITSARTPSEADTLADVNIKKIKEALKEGDVEADPIVVSKSFDFFVTGLTNTQSKVQKTIDGLKREKDEKLKEEFLFKFQEKFEEQKQILFGLQAAQKKYVALPEVKEALKIAQDKGVLEIAAKAVDLQEKAQLTLVADSILNGVNEIILDGSKNFISIKNPEKLKDEEAKLTTNIWKHIEKNTPDSHATTVLKQMDVLLEIIQKQLDDPQIPKENKAALDKTSGYIETAKASFKEAKKIELKTEADKSGIQRSVFESMRKMVLVESPRTVHEEFRLIFPSLETDPNWVKLINKATEPVFHYIGQAIKDTNMESPMLARIMLVTQVMRAVKQPVMLATRRLMEQENRLTKMEVLK